MLAASARFDRTTIPFDPPTSRRTFGFFISDVGALRLAPPLMERLEREAPHVSVRMVSLERRQLLPRLESGEVDIAIGAFPDLVQGIRRRKLFSESYAILVRRGHQFAAAAPSEGSFLGAHHVLVMARDTGHAHAVAERYLENIIPPDRIALRVAGFVAAAMVVKRTNMVTVMPANLATYLAQEFDLALIKAPFLLPELEIALTWHERFHHDSGSRWMRGVLLQILGRRNRAGVQEA